MIQSKRKIKMLFCIFFFVNSWENRNFTSFVILFLMAYICPRVAAHQRARINIVSTPIFPIKIASGFCPRKIRSTSMYLISPAPREFSFWYKSILPIQSNIIGIIWEALYMFCGSGIRKYQKGKKNRRIRSSLFGIFRVNISDFRMSIFMLRNIDTVKMRKKVSKKNI